MHAQDTPHDTPPETAQANPSTILSLAIPAFLALVAEPLFLLVDSAVVGRLGVVPLAGLGAASAVLLTVAGIFVFLAYATTAVVARRVGAGNPRSAIEGGIAGVWLAGLLGLLAVAAVIPLAPRLVAGVSSSPAVAEQAVIYLRISTLGLPAMLVLLAATGILRGVLDTRTPVLVAGFGFTLNAVLSVLLVHPIGWGIAGAAWASVIAQCLMSTAMLVVVARRAREAGASLRPHPRRVLEAAMGGAPLVIRTLALRGVLLLLVGAAAAFGDPSLAAYQVTATVWTFLTFTLDALAIAGQALTGHALGASDTDSLRATTGLMVRWGIWAGAAMGVALIALHRVLPGLFTPDPAVQSAIGAGMVVVGLSAPLAGYVFVVDGVLMGAGDNRWLAGSMTALLVLFLPVVALLRWAVPAATEALGATRLPVWGEVTDEQIALVGLWIAMAVFMALRGSILGWRLRGDTWAVTGETR